MLLLLPLSHAGRHDPDGQTDRRREGGREGGKVLRVSHEAVASIGKREMLRMMG